MIFTPFEQLSLSEPLLRAVEEMGFTGLTEIQAQSIPYIQQGRDLIGRSQTGSGKTLAFGIPAVEAVDPQLRQPQVLILCPTRELAMQCCAQLRKLSRYRPGVRPEEIYGGVSMGRQIYALRGGANIIVGTPGRIMDHIRRGTLSLEKIGLVILDEADEMLSMGFQEDIETILKDTSTQRQTVLFSATMPAEILSITQKFQRDPVMVEIDKKQPSVKTIRQLSYEVPPTHKMEALQLLLCSYHPHLAIIFCNTKSATDQLTEYLIQHGLEAQGLHGDMKQQQRTQVLSGFKSARTHILVATDVAARGIDVENVDLVVNFDLPSDPEYYIHRIGRTGRAGKSGTAISLYCGRRQQWQLRDLAKFAKSEIESLSLPTTGQVMEMEQQRLLEEMENRLTDLLKPSCMALAQRLLEKANSLGKTPEETVALLLEQLGGNMVLPEVPALTREKSERPARVRDSVRTAAARRRQDENAAYLLLGIGKRERVTPRHIVGALTQYTNLSGLEIGRIELYEDHTIVGIPREKLAGVLAQLQSLKICGQRTKVEPCGGGTLANQSHRSSHSHPSRFPHRHRTTGQSEKKRLN